MCNYRRRIEEYKVRSSTRQARKPEIWAKGGLRARHHGETPRLDRHSPCLGKAFNHRAITAHILPRLLGTCGDTWKRWGVYALLTTWANCKGCALAGGAYSHGPESPGSYPSTATTG